MEFEQLGTEGLRKLLDSIADGVLVVDAAGVIQYSNGAAAKMLGRPAEQLVDTEFGVPLVAGDKEEIELHGDNGSAICELRVATSELGGQRLWLVSLRDVTDGVRSRDERERARRDAEAMARARAALLNMVAHEFRSPLGVISGYVSMILAEDLEPVPEAWKEPLLKVAEKAQELRAMVNDVLMSARLEAGGMKAAPQPVDLGKLARSAARRAAGRAALLPAKLTARVPEKPVLALADPSQIAIVIDNLVNNALTYCSEEDPWVEVAVEAGDSGMACVAVSDNGIGIPPDQQEAIFDRFRRIDPTDGPLHGGTGLGLAIAKELAELNGGALALDSSTPGKGSRFVIKLPAPPDAAA